MRSRYSRKVYSLERLSENTDYIDDEDMVFLENVLSFHKKYKENLKKELNFDTSLLAPEFQKLYEKININFNLINTSKIPGKNKLYSTMDLIVDGEELHIRNLREKIVNYLNNKKNQIFTNHRVEFFFRIVLNEKSESLREVCQEVIYSEKSVKKLSEECWKKQFDKPVIEKKYMDNFVDESLKPSGYNRISNNMDGILESEDDDAIFKKLANRDILLLPFIRMIHSEKGLDYEKADRFISDILEKEEMEKNFNNEDHKTKIDTIYKTNGILTQNIVKPTSPNFYRNSKTHDQPSFINIHHKDSNISNDITHSLGRPTSPTNFAKYNRLEPHASEVIEISDEETDENRTVIKSNAIDQMIDYIIHQCGVSQRAHPTLLNDQQLQVELNVFLLFINYTIRFSLKFPLDERDRHIFDCIFISSLIVGLTCVVCINGNGIRIEGLSNHAYEIINARLKSVQLSVRQVTKLENNLYSLLINSDISQLIHLSLQYVRGYHKTGKLIERKDVLSK